MTQQGQAVLARALYDFTGDPAVRQLSFKKDDVIKVTHQYENGWWAGEINGKIGYLPSTYIKLEGSASPAPVPTRTPPQAKPSPGASPSASPAAARGNPPPPGGGKPSPTLGAAKPSPTPPTRTPPAEPAKPSNPFTMQSVTSSGPVQAKPAPQTPPARVPPPKPAPSTQSHPPPQPHVQPKPAPPFSKPPPSITSKPPTQTQAPTSAPRQVGGGGAWASAATPGSEANEADFNELDSLIKSLQEEVLDLKKLL